MDTGTGKAIEALVIVGLIWGFYHQQQSALKRSKSEAEARQSEILDPASKPDRER